MSEAPGYSQTVLAYDPGSRGAMSYVDAAREIAEAGAGRVGTVGRESGTAVPGPRSGVQIASGPVRSTRTVHSGATATERSGIR